MCRVKSKLFSCCGYLYVTKPRGRLLGTLSQDLINTVQDHRERESVSARAQAGDIYTQESVARVDRYRHITEHYKSTMVESCLCYSE